MPILFELFAGHSGPRAEGAQGNLDGLHCTRGFAASRVQFGLEERMQGDLFGGRNRRPRCVPSLVSRGQDDGGALEGAEDRAAVTKLSRTA